MNILKTLYNAWMKFAHVLGWVNTRIILTAVYFVMITPVAITFKFIGKDIMRIKPESLDSYWIKREPEQFNKDHYKRQF